MKKCNMCNCQVNDNFVTCPNCGSTNLSYYNTAPMNSNPGYYPNYMPQQPVQNTYQAPTQAPGNMPMTFASIYIVILGVITVYNASDLVNGLSLSVIGTIIYNLATIYFLVKRAKTGRILAMIYGIYQVVVGSGILVYGTLIVLGLTALFGEYVSYFVSAFSFIYIVAGLFNVIYGICSYKYFSKRSSMYIN